MKPRRHRVFIAANRRINMVRDFFSIKEAADVLGIYEVSAKELLDGTIDFESDELFTLASSAGVSLAELLA
jgi:predicted XRE-type DNA-binding protein